MVFVDEQFAVADCSAGNDIAAKKEWQKSSHNRLIRGFALVGGNAALECVLSVKVNKVIVATLKNDVTGLLIETHTDWRPISSMLMVPANVELQIVVESAPTVSPIRLLMDLPEV